MAELPAAMPGGPSDPGLVWELADQVWAWLYPPLKVSMTLESGIWVEGVAEDLLTPERHRELAKALRAAAEEAFQRARNGAAKTKRRS